MDEGRLRGAPISEGVAIGELVFLPAPQEESIPENVLSVEDLECEIARYQQALLASREDLLFLKFRLEKECAEEAVEVIEAHIQMLEDPLLTVHVEEMIRLTRKNAEFVFYSVVQEYEQRFAKMKDPFFLQRIVDVLDLSKRVLEHLLDKQVPQFSDIPAGSIIFAKELAPSHTATMQASKVGAFVTQYGGESSHAALIARARGIPYVCNIDLDALLAHKKGDVVVDGTAGEVILSPSQDTVAEYRERRRDLKTQYRLLQKDTQVLTSTTDGYPVHIYANIGGMGDLDALSTCKPVGIGLLRSEYLFLEKNVLFLSEDEQMTMYRRVLEKAAGLSVVMRVFDIGGDKHPDVFLEHAKELNPVLGCRGIRFLLRHSLIFRTQLRAIMRVAQNEDVRLLLPLVSDVQEIIQAKKIIAEVQEELRAEGWSRSRPFLMGCMIEVPSVVFLVDAVAREVDFLSIGTNDLAQYTLGVDRSNPTIGELFYPAHPSLIRMIKMVVVEAKKQNKPVAICGEIASHPTFTPLLLGLGISEFSCSPRYIPLVKRAVRLCSLQGTFKLTQKILQMSTSAEVAQALAEIAEEFSTIP